MLAKDLLRNHLVGFLTTPKNDIPDDPDVAGSVLAHHCHSLNHRGVSREGCLDLAEFDSESSNLYLAVVSPDELQVSVRAKADQVAGPVESRARRGSEEVGQKALGREVRAVDVSTGHAIPADEELSRDPDRDGLEKGV
ncbi:MAG: hypothetical protein WCG77_10710 [Actinomycetes bacterium]